MPGLLWYSVYCFGVVSTALHAASSKHQMYILRDGHDQAMLSFSFATCLCSSHAIIAMFHCLQWGELSKRPQAGAGGMPDLALQLRVSKNALRSPAFQEEIVSQVCSLFRHLLPTDLLCYGRSSKTPCSGWLSVCTQQLHVDGVFDAIRVDDNAPLSRVEGAMTLHCLLDIPSCAFNACKCRCC